jgi:hypothetical protein
MKITSKSFREKLPLIVEAIQSCDYYAIDTEYSGFATSQRDKTCPYDSLQSRYQKIKFLCQNHLAWQIGLSAFKFDTNTGSYKCKTFSLLVFPTGSAISTWSFIITSNALKFLCKHHFFFYKTTTEGIGFQQAVKEKEVIKGVLLNKSSVHASKIHPGKETQEEISKIKERIDDWLLKEEGSIQIECSEFLRNYFIESNYLKHLNVNTKIEFNKLIITKNISISLTEDKNKPNTTSKSPYNDREEMGLSLLVGELVKCKKPLVGHNFIHDLAFFYYQFIDDFPETHEQFKEKLHECFPIIYDTKIIASTLRDKFPCTDLVTVVKKLLHLINR